MDKAYETVRIMHMNYSNMTSVEKSIADFFIQNKEMMDFASRKISKILYVSEATLSRFAQKCGFSGYREFIFAYTRDLEIALQDAINEKDISQFTTKVKELYETLLNQNITLLNEKNIRALAERLNKASRVVVFGVGSSGYSALEFQLRFMRLGMNVQAVTDTQMMRITASLADQDTVILALSLSGHQQEILESIRIGQEKGAYTVCLCANKQSELALSCDVHLPISTIQDLDTGTMISPQFSLLVIIDILYSYYFANDSYFKAQKYSATLEALKVKQ